MVSFPDDPLRCSREPAVHKLSELSRVQESLATGYCTGEMRDAADHLQLNKYEWLDYCTKPSSHAALRH